MTLKDDAQEKKIIFKIKRQDILITSIRNKRGEIIKVLETLKE